ncbi:hypothetical protein BC829DRAFT_491487 [Chytridium lagenaria]|nr:hypothetical protein BC829DRAFT_491487 [Chytridium lagenaria]
MSSKMKDNPDYEPEDLDDIDDDTENDDAGPSSAARPSSGPPPKTSSNVMKLGQNPFGVPPGDASSKKSTTTVPQVRPTIQESKKMPRAPQPMPPIRSDAFLNAHQYTREKMRVLDVQQNFMLHEFVADHRMTVNIINNGTHLEYKIFPVTLNAQDFMDIFSDNPLSGVNKAVVAYFPQELHPAANEEYTYIIPLPEPVETTVIQKRQIYRKVLAPAWTDTENSPDSTEGDLPQYRSIYPQPKAPTKHLICQPVASVMTYKVPGFGTDTAYGPELAVGANVGMKRESNTKLINDSAGLVTCMRNIHVAITERLSDSKQGQKGNLPGKNPLNDIPTTAKVNVADAIQNLIYGLTLLQEKNDGTIPMATDEHNGQPGKKPRISFSFRKHAPTPKRKVALKNKALEEEK